MYSIERYHFAASLEEAYELVKKSARNRVFGGGTWLRLGKPRLSTAIDLSRLGLNTITETDEAVKIGASVTLRQLETSEILKKNFGGALSACVAPIVGVQFRNMATVGANVYSRAGFSDIIPVLLALDASVTLFGAGEMSVQAFLRSDIKRDILTEITVPKRGQNAVALSHRRTATDFPQLTVCMSRTADGEYRLAVGARPGRAVLCESAAALLKAGQPEQAAKNVQENVSFDGNLRGSAEYRRALAGVLTVRAWNALREG